MKESTIYKNLDKLYNESFDLTVADEDRLVIFSDLHMGDGGSRDDFAGNSGLFRFILDNYYKPRDYTLVLNGDVEELYKFSIKSIYKAWKGLYRIYEHFESAGKFIKIIGNHDHEDRKSVV